MKQANLKAFIVLLFIFNGTIYCQSMLKIVAGAGIAEITHIGTEIGNNRSALGINVGYLPLSEEYLLGFSVHYMGYFKGESDFEGLRLWFLRTGFQFLKDENNSIIDRFIYYNASIGRNFYFTEKSGIALDAGLLVELYYKQTEKVPSGGWDVGPDAPLLPAVSIKFFYRI